jgi:hypothetical protein
MLHVNERGGKARRTQEDAPMKHVIRAGLVLAIALGPAVSAQAVDDVLGWKNTTWSMTEPDVRRSVEALGLRLTTVPASAARVQGGEGPFKTVVGVEGRECDVTFRFSSDTRRLERVVVCGLAFSREHALKLHGGVLRALTEAYGAPSEAEARGALVSVTRWSFTTTTVTLSMYTDTATPGHRPTQVSLTYAPTPRRTADKDKLLALGLFRLLGEAWRH